MIIVFEINGSDVHTERLVDSPSTGKLVRLALEIASENEAPVSDVSIRFVEGSNVD